jgi:hypothetical protein
MKSKKQSVFMQMHTGVRTGEGSFNVALKELFYKADTENRRKLVGAFPEFFGDEVPEFGIIKKARGGSVSISMSMSGNGNIQSMGAVSVKMVNKTFKYKGWTCEWNNTEQAYLLYTPDEMEQPRGFRQEEFVCETKEFCKQFIDTY